MSPFTASPIPRSVTPILPPTMPASIIASAFGASSRRSSTSNIVSSPSTSQSQFCPTYVTVGVTEGSTLKLVQPSAGGVGPPGPTLRFVPSRQRTSPPAGRLASIRTECIVASVGESAHLLGVPWVRLLDAIDVGGALRDRLDVRPSCSNREWYVSTVTAASPANRSPCHRPRSYGLPISTSRRNRPWSIVAVDQRYNLQSVDASVRRRRWHLRLTRRFPIPNRGQIRRSIRVRWSGAGPNVLGQRGPSRTATHSPRSADS